MQVMMVSALTNQGVDRMWEMMQEYQSTLQVGNECMELVQPVRR